MSRDELKDEPTGFWELDDADETPNINLTASEVFAVLTVVTITVIALALILGA